MTLTLNAFHGTSPGAPLTGGKDPVSSKILECLWVSNSYYLAAQFQDGEVRRLSITLQNPLIITQEDRGSQWAGKSHAKIVAEVMQAAHSGAASFYSVVFPQTVDGMECGDVAAIFERKISNAVPSVDHCVTHIGSRIYDHSVDAWVSDCAFNTDIDAAPECWQLTS
jgi:hypothetical protein